MPRPVRKRAAQGAILRGARCRGLRADQCRAGQKEGVECARHWVSLQGASMKLVWVLLAAGALAQQAAPRQTPSNPKVPVLVFSETWKQTGLERNVDNDVVANPNLELKLYGSTSK